MKQIIKNNDKITVKEYNPKLLDPKNIIKIADSIILNGLEVMNSMITNELLTPNQRISAYYSVLNTSKYLSKRLIDEHQAGFELDINSVEELLD